MSDGNGETKRRHLALINMLAAYPWPGENSTDLLRRYDSVLCMEPAIPVRIIEAACAAISLGMVPGVDLACAPSPPFVRKIAQSYEWVADWLNHH